MALYRIQARLTFTKASGLATWARDQMAVRYGQAVHINEGKRNEEQPLNEVRDRGDDELFVCDLPLMNQSHAQDAFNTLTAPSVWSEAKAGGEEEQGSSINLHVCHHDENPPLPCEIIERKVKEAEEYPVWQQPTGAHDAYQTGDIVQYGSEHGELWISKIDANTTVPDGDWPHNRFWEPYELV